MLTVFKASAGSGKTFQLVGEYLKLILSNPHSYRNILAVTFTNKATAEMKNRILEQLNQLAGTVHSPYISMLKEALQLNEAHLRIRAKAALKNILHDYSRFSVSTIDAFTQRVIKAFNREMGISPYFVLELDNDLILEEAVDRLLLRIDTDLQLRKWLVEYSREKIMENRSRQIESDILSLGRELFKEKFQIFFPENEKSAYTRESIQKLRNDLNKIISVFENILQSKATECLQHLESNGYTVDDILHKKAGVAGFLVNLSEKEIREPKVRVFSAAESADNWITKNHPQKKQILQLVEDKLRPLLLEILSIIDKNELAYNSALEVKKHLRILGILTDLKDEIKSLLQEKGILQMSDSNLLLSKIIGDSDSPFIYEKIGNRYDYFMLDEFQDTSQLQWNNFKPLISNALSEGNNVLLVGDVKQAIYRWRNSDWNILATQINEDFPLFPPATISLEKNWRSQKNIIDFNNNVLSAMIRAYEDVFFNTQDNSRHLSKFKNVYNEYFQEPGNPTAKDEGIVEVHFLENEAFEKQSALLLIDQVKILQDQGLKASEIAILIRKKDEGAVLVETFMEASKQPENAGYNLNVLSNESLFLYSSRGVNFVILIIELFINPDDNIHKTALLYIWLSWLKPLQKEHQSDAIKPNGSDLSAFAQMGLDTELLFDSELGNKIEEIDRIVKLSSLDEVIIRICKVFGLYDIGSELPFLQSLIDKAAELKISLSNDLSNFLNWWKTKGYNSSVSINEEVDSIWLLTVHKSKGLEFEAVLIPFFTFPCLWPSNRAPLLWCSPSIEPFSNFPLLPVNANPKLIKTIFNADYQEESVSYLIDTLNLIYVAFTRARSALFIHAVEPVEKKNGEPGKNVNDLLRIALQKMTLQNEFSRCWNDEEKIFSIGALPVRKHDVAIKKSNAVVSYVFNDIDNRIRMKMKSDGFILESDHSQSTKDTGKLIHEILSKVKVADDIETICNQFFAEGLINASERNNIMNTIRQGIERTNISHWFDGTYDVIFNERDLLTPTGIQRPDRVMVSDKQAIVADYKWGEIKLQEYNAQVNRYAHTIQRIGFDKVEGYIWYINLGEVEKVCELKGHV